MFLYSKMPKSYKRKLIRKGQKESIRVRVRLIFKKIVMQSFFVKNKKIKSGCECLRMDKINKL